MGYENDPATRMLATHCAVCGRPLRDAHSVETGVGPDCRETHGYAVVTGPADWVAAGRFLLPTLLARPQTDAFQAAWDAQDGRTVANTLIHRVATEQRGLHVSAYVAALRALGFGKIADAMAKRLGAVFVEQEGATLVVRAPFNRHFNDAMRDIRGTRWDQARTARMVPVSAREALWNALCRTFGEGTLVIGRTTAVTKSR